MGVFDYVNFECCCPVCKAKVGGFQTKSGDCLLDTLEPSAVSNFYGSCDKCGSWIEFESEKCGKFRRTVLGENREIIPEHTKDILV